MEIPRSDHNSTIDNFNHNLLDPNLLVRSTHLTIGSHTNWLVHYSIGRKIMLHVRVVCSVMWVEILYLRVFEILCFVHLGFWNSCFKPHVFQILNNALMEFRVMSSCLRNLILCPPLIKIFLFFTPLLFLSFFRFSLFFSSPLGNNQCSGVHVLSLSASSLFLFLPSFLLLLLLLLNFRFFLRLLLPRLAS